jgi:hypothetical protein
MSAIEQAASAAYAAFRLSAEHHYGQHDSAAWKAAVLSAEALEAAAKAHREHVQSFMDRMERYRP